MLVMTVLALLTITSAKSLPDPLSNGRFSHMDDSDMRDLIPTAGVIDCGESFHVVSNMSTASGGSSSDSLIDLSHSKCQHKVKN